MREKRNVIWLVVLVSAFGLLVPVVRADIVTGISGYWQLDGNYNDASGNNLPLVNAGGAPAPNPDGHIGSCYEFDNIDHTQGLATKNPISVDASEGVTLTAWINPSVLNSGFSTTSPHVIARFYYWNGSSVTGELQFRIRDSKLEVYYTNPGKNNLSSLVVPTNQWSFVAVTQSGTGLNIYLNDQKQSFTVDGSLPYNRLVLATYGAGSHRGLDGRLDEARFYERALTDSDISEVYSYVPEPASVMFAILGMGLLRKKH